MSKAIARAAVLANRHRAVRALASSGVRADLARAVVEGKQQKPQIFALAPAGGEVGELYIYEAIGFDCFAEGGGVTAQKVQAALDEMKGIKTLNIFVNSEGGDVFEAKAIYAQLERFKAEKVVHVDGLAASAATLIAMAGDRIITNPVATWMVHRPWSGAMGDEEDMERMRDLLRLEGATLAELYARQTGGTPEEMAALMAAETWMNATAALEKGFTDEIGSADEEQDDEGEEQLAASKRSPVALAAAVTQNRLKASSTGQQLAARAARLRGAGPAPSAAGRGPLAVNGAPKS